MSECYGAEAENLAASAPLAKLVELPVEDVPVTEVGVPADTHGEDFAVFAFDVEDVRPAVVEEQVRLAVELCLDEAGDVLEGREMVLRQFLADVRVAGVLLEERRDVGSVVGSDRCLDGFEEPGLDEKGVPTDQPVDDRLERHLHGYLDLVATAEKTLCLLTVEIELGQEFFGGIAGCGFHHRDDLAALALRDRLSRHRDSPVEELFPLCQEKRQLPVSTVNV